MAKKRDLAATLEKYRKRSDGVRISMFMSKAIYEEFKTFCGGVSVSAVLESWMKQAIEDEKKKLNQEWEKK